jgi:hypothetical protein
VSPLLRVGPCKRRMKCEEDWKSAFILNKMIVLSIEKADPPSAIQTGTEHNNQEVKQNVSRSDRASFKKLFIFSLFSILQKSFN